MNARKEEVMSVTYHSSLEALSEIENPTAAWWAQVARALDDLAEQLLRDAAVDGGPSGAFAQAVARDPSLANLASRLDAERVSLWDRVGHLRRLVTQVAGDPDQTAVVSTELSSVAAARDLYRQRAHALFWDSFLRDMGGQ